jgi:DNA-directed RNA polymerase sigma subunit (sigma70/sigma32)
MSKIAERLGMARGAVLGRLHRLSGAALTYPSYIRQEKEARARSAARLRERSRINGTAIQKMRRELARGVERNKAIANARNAGATLRAIGDVFGVTRERIRQIAHRQSRFENRDS